MIQKGEKKVLPPPHPRKLKLLTTCAVLFGNITFGCAFNFFAPALEELRNKYDTTIDDISRVFTVMLLCFMAGALTTGFIYNWVNRQLGVIVCLAGISCAIILTPHCPTKSMFFTLGGLLGFFIGAYDTTQVVWMIEIWQSKSGPYIQAQNFCYALGSNIPPLLLGPFLAKSSHVVAHAHALIDPFPSDLNDTLTLTDDFNETVSNTTDLSSFSEESFESRIYIPFAIAGFLNLMSMCFQIYLFLFHRYYMPPLEEELEAENNNELSEKASLTNSNFSVNREYISKMQQTPAKSETAGINWPRIRLVLIAAVFIGAYCGMEVCTLQFTPTFGQYSNLKLSESDSAFVLTGVTATYAIGRALGIFIVLKVPPILMLCGNLTLVLIGNCILFGWANNSLTMLWTGCIVLGFGFSTIYASFCAFIERHLLFTNGIGAFMVFMGSIFASSYPLVVGRFIEQNAIVLTYTNFFSIALCVIALATAYFMTYKNTSRVG